MTALFGDPPVSSTTMRSAIRTVEKRCEISSAILPAVSSAKRWNTSIFRAGVQRSGRLVENQDLRVAQVCAGQRDFLPFAAGKIHPALEAPARAVCSYCLGSRADDLFRQALSRRFGNAGMSSASSRPSDAAMFCRAVISYRMKSWKMTPIWLCRSSMAVLAEVHPVQQNAPSGGIVEPREQFHERCLALAVFADQRDALAGLDAQIESVQDAPRRSPR